MQGPIFLRMRGQEMSAESPRRLWEPPSLNKNHRTEASWGNSINSFKVGDEEVEAKINALNGDERTG